MALTPAGWSYEVYETTGNEDLASLVKQAVAHSCQMIVVAGGDGTISAVADGLAPSRIPLGIIPVGTGNVLAQELGIPLDPDEAWCGPTPPPWW